MSEESFGYVRSVSKGGVVVMFTAHEETIPTWFSPAAPEAGDVVFVARAAGFPIIGAVYAPKSKEGSHD